MVGVLENLKIFTVGCEIGVISRIPSDTKYVKFEAPFGVPILQNIYFLKKKLLNFLYKVWVPPHIAEFDSEFRYL